MKPPAYEYILVIGVPLTVSSVITLNRNLRRRVVMAQQN